MTMYLFKLITLFGGLALFLFGMDVMGKALERTAGGKLQTILLKMSSNVAVEMLQVAEGKLEAHEYLNALKAGELSESAAFVERFAKYRAKYAFPEEV